MAQQHHPAGATMRVSRRQFSLMAAGLCAAGLLPRSVLAQAQLPRLTVGDWTVTVIDDGTLVFPLSIVTPDAPVATVVDLLGAQVETDMVRYPSNALLLQGHGETMLIDTGTGAGVQPTGGLHLQSLADAGVQPDAVTRVVYTHAHPDHLWGSVSGDGAVLFPNASFAFSQAEWAFWTDPTLATQMPAEMAGLVQGTQTRLTALAERSERFAPGDEVAPGIRSLDTSGHTPGHVSFEIAGGDGLIVVGDLIITPSVFFAHPGWRFGFDTDGDASVRHRRQLLDRAATDRIALIGYHWPAPGIGFAEVRGDGYHYVAQA